MYPGSHKNMHFDLTYDGGIFVGTYILYSNPAPETYTPVMQVCYHPPNYKLGKGTVYYIPPPYTSSVALEGYPIYLFRLQDVTLVRLKIPKLVPLAILPPPPTQPPQYDTDVPAWLQDGNKVSYYKYSVWIKCKINKLP